MPIEIKELVVRAVTNSDKKQERTPSSADGFIKKKKAQEMVVEVFKQMKNKKDR